MQFKDKRFQSVGAAFSAVAAVLSAPAWGQGTALHLNDLFQDHMVLPRHDGAVFGTAAPLDRVDVVFGAHHVVATADAAGRWRAMLPDLPAGETGHLIVAARSGGKVDLQDVVAGDVFLCSGQSNMEFRVRQSLSPEALAAVQPYDGIRQVEIAHDDAPAPRAHFRQTPVWQTVSAGTVGNWSAACYFFAQNLQKTVKAPIGLVNASYGGSNITVWIDAAHLRPLPGQAPELDLLKVYAADPVMASGIVGHGFEAWWRSHGGPVSPQAPWEITPEAMQAWTPAPDVSQFYGKWGDPKLVAYTGSLWYAAHLTLTADQARQAAELDLGLIDEIDHSWVNGQPVGYTSGPGTLRRYHLPAGVLKAGDNTVVISVLNTWGDGGLYGPGPRRLTFSDGAQVSLPDTAWVYAFAPPHVGWPPRAPWDVTGGVTVLSNAMIAPMDGFSFKAALWYQGESNVASPGPYADLLKALIADWRQRFSPDLPFAIVQLPNFGPVPTAPAPSNWAQVREAERRVALEDKAATLATAVDIGDPINLHPTNKQALGERLARAVAVKVYGQTGRSESGPAIARAERRGGEVVLSFRDVEGQLTAPNGPALGGFELCSASACHYAPAEIRKGQVVLSGPDVASAIKVRYAWADNPTCTLHDDKSGLPALPFEQTLAR